MSGDLGMVLARLARETAILQGRLGEVLQHITETAAAALSIERVNIWLFNRSRTRLDCIEAFQSSSAIHSSGDSLGIDGRFRYFAAIEQMRTVITLRSSQDERTSELQDYFRQYGISTMLDAPIYREGVVIGVVCHEQVGETREWTEAEKGFAGSIADAVSLAIEADRRLGVERELRRREQQLRQLFFQFPAVVRARDAAGRLLFANDTLTEGNDPNAASVYPKTCETVPTNAVSADPLAQSAPLAERTEDEEVLASGVPRKTLGQPRTHPNGETRFVDQYLIPVPNFDGDSAAVLDIAIDVSESIREREQRLDEARQLYESQKLNSLGLLAGGIAHDFKNLLVGILGNAALALAETPPPHPLRSRLFDIETAAKRAAELCQQLLAYSGRGNRTIEPVDLSMLVRESVRLLEVSISKRATINLDLAPDLPAIEGDLTQLRQIIMNLAINASDALESEYGTITIRTRAERVDDNLRQNLGWNPPAEVTECVVLEVADTGKGIPTTLLPRIFEPFFSTKDAGRGLGLSAVAGIARSHDGVVDVRSVTGAGTVFTVHFPASKRKAPAPVEEIEEAELPSAGAAVLVVDDEPMVRRVAQRTLRSAGLVVYEASDGRQALALLARYPEIRVVLLDVRMPNMDGADTLLAMESQFPRARVILSSGYHAEDAARRVEDRPAAGFLEKPWHPQQLLTLVKHALEGE